MSKVVLITGCSTGIGRDLAEHLSQTGYTVIATARRSETLDGLRVALKLQLDVTKQDSVDRAVEQVVQHFGRIDVLVNNAGYAVRGAVEDVPIEKVQGMFDANVFGVMRMIRAVLPHMRQQRAGRIINISSVAGKLVIPANGTYSASKFALEALSNALRLELAPFGIDVVVIEPGSIKTQFHKTVESNAWMIFSNSNSAYWPLYKQYQKVNTDMRQEEVGPKNVSQVVKRVIETRRSKPRYIVGFPITGRLVLHLGDSVWDMVVRQMFRIASSNG